MVAWTSCLPRVARSISRTFSTTSATLGPTAGLRVSSTMRAPRSPSRWASRCTTATPIRPTSCWHGERPRFSMTRTVIPTSASSSMTAWSLSFIPSMARPSMVPRALLPSRMNRTPTGALRPPDWAATGPTTTALPVPWNGVPCSPRPNPSNPLGRQLSPSSPRATSTPCTATAAPSSTAVVRSSTTRPTATSTSSSTSRRARLISRTPCGCRTMATG